MTMTKRLNILIGTCALFGTYFAIERTVGEKFFQSMRQLRSSTPTIASIHIEGLIEDGRQICEGPLRSFNKYTTPLYYRAHYALHVGHSVSNSHVGDSIIIMFNALDTALVSGNLTVVVVSGWAEEFMNIFFPDDESWQHAYRDLPIVREKDAIPFELLAMKHTSQAMFMRGAEALKEQISWQETHQHRLAILHYMFSSLKGEACNNLHHFIGFLTGRFTNSRYVAISLRHVQGGCKRFNHLHPEQCAMEDSYIKSILEPLGELGKLPIVLLGDEVDEPKMKALQALLPNVIIPQLDVGTSVSVLTHMAIGGMSEVFIGNEGCSISRNIGVIREAFGKDPNTSYVFTEKTEEGLVKSVIPEFPYTWNVGDIDGTGLWP